MSQLIQGKRAGLIGLIFMLAAGMAFAQSNNETDASSEPQVKIKDRHQDWTVRCKMASQQAFGSGDICEMYQQVDEQESQQTVLEIVIGYPSEGEQPVALFFLPLGIRLPPGVELRVDENEPVRFPIQLCSRNGCRADIELTSALVTQMRAGSEAVLVIADPQGRGVGLPLSLQGFSAALDDVQSSIN